MWGDEWIMRSRAQGQGAPQDSQVRIRFSSDADRLLLGGIFPLEIQLETVEVAPWMVECDDAQLWHCRQCWLKKPCA